MCKLKFQLHSFFLKKLRNIIKTQTYNYKNLNTNSDESIRLKYLLVKLKFVSHKFNFLFLVFYFQGFLVFLHKILKILIKEIILNINRMVGFKFGVKWFQSSFHRSCDD
jgi:hypothetical protein